MSSLATVVLVIGVALSAAFALFGVAVGATSGLLVAPHVVENFDSPVARLFAGLGIVALMVIIGQVAGQTIGRALRSTISGSTVARGVDSLIGAVLSEQNDEWHVGRRTFRGAIGQVKTIPETIMQPQMLAA